MRTGAHHDAVGATSTIARLLLGRAGGWTTWGGEVPALLQGEATSAGVAARGEGLRPWLAALSPTTPRGFAQLPAAELATAYPTGPTERCSRVPWCSPSATNRRRRRTVRGESSCAVCDGRQDGREGDER